MTLNSHFALNSVFRVESFSVHAVVLKQTEMRILYCQQQRCSPRPVVSGDMSYADIRRGSPLRLCQMTVRSQKMRVFSFDRYIFRMKFPTGFTYRIYSASRGFLATARLLLLLRCQYFCLIHPLLSSHGPTATTIFHHHQQHQQEYRRIKLCLHLPGVSRTSIKVTSIIYAESS